MKDSTRAIYAGRNPKENFGVVNAPVYHASTILFPTLDELKNSRNIPSGDGYTYAVHGTPSSYAFEDSVAALEGGYRTRICQSGLTATTAPILCYASAGDHILMVDSTYGPTRSFCDSMLKRMGIETEYYDPLIGVGIKDLLRPNTSVVFTESPGSWTFEVQDIPAIAEEAHKVGAVVLMDNTWASPLFFKPFEHGVDVSIQAATKYIAGHSDLVMGTVTATKEAYPKLQKGWADLGLCAAPDDIFLAARGIRTMPTRMKAQMQSGIDMAYWLMERPEIETVLHPALPHDPGHEIWKRDFLGASSLFGFIFKPEYSSHAQLSALMDHLKYFGMGFSWGGFESLLIATNPKNIRAVTKWAHDGEDTGQTMRIHIGLEDLDDLKDDLAEGFARMKPE